MNVIEKLFKKASIDREYTNGYKTGYEAGHNQSHDEWKAFLPEAKEIRTIMRKWIEGTPCNSMESELFTLSWRDLKSLAQVIAKRIGK